MAVAMQKAPVRPPALELKDLVEFAHQKVGPDLLKRDDASHDAIEICGQSGSLLDGFRKIGLRCLAYDYRAWISDSLVSFLIDRRVSNDVYKSIERSI